MRIVLMIWVFFLLGLESLNGQKKVVGENPFHRLGNLYVVTIDKSYSITRDVPNYSTVINADGFSIDPLLRSLSDDSIQFDFNRDRFVFFTSGLECPPGPELSEVEQSKEPFYKLFLMRKTKSKSTEFFRNKRQLETRTRSILAERNYANSSFVSLLKYEAMASVLSSKPQDKSGCLRFRNVYVINITDDKDQNDKWAADLRIFKRYMPNRLKEVNAQIDYLHYNPLNSESKHNGFFEELSYDDSARIRIIPFKYLSFSDRPDTGLVRSWLHFDISKDTLTVHLKSAKINPSGFYPEGIWISKLTFNDKLVFENKFIDSKGLIAKITNAYPYSRNIIRVSGYAQTVVGDSIFGKRVIAVPISFEYAVHSQSYATINYSFLALFFVTAISFIVYWFAVYRKKCFVYVEDDTGFTFTVQNAFYLKNKKPLVELAHFFSSPALTVTCPSEYVLRNERKIESQSDGVIYVCANKQLHIVQHQGFELKEFSRSNFSDSLFYGYHHARLIENKVKVLIDKYSHVYVCLRQDKQAGVISFMRSLRQRDEYKISISQSPEEQKPQKEIPIILHRLLKNVYEREKVVADIPMLFIWDDEGKLNWSVIELGASEHVTKATVVYHYAINGLLEVPLNTLKFILRLIIDNPDFCKVQGYYCLPQGYSFAFPILKKAFYKELISDDTEQQSTLYWWKISRYPIAQYLYCEENTVPNSKAKLIYNPFLHGPKKRIVYKEPAPIEVGYNIVSAAFCNYKEMLPERNRLFKSRSKQPFAKGKLDIWLKPVQFLKNIFFPGFLIEN